MAKTSAARQMSERKRRAEDSSAHKTMPQAMDKKRARGSRAPQDLDRLIHERLRLGIVSALAVNKTMSFSDLKKLVETTDGNLSIHARKLEDAGYVACSKGFDGRVPRTEYSLTAAGRRALERYLSHMERLIRVTREG